MRYNPNKELYHHGILGMKWSIRRYQNKDGTLTPEGRKKLGLDKYDENHNQDIVLKKGTKATRVVYTPFLDEFSNPEYGGSTSKGKKYLNNILEKEKTYDRKYVSVDNVRNSGRHNGRDFYLNWFTNDMSDPDSAIVATYELKKDTKVASGKQVIDAIISEYGQKKIKNILKNNDVMKSITMDYTTNSTLFNKVNKSFIDKGYDAIEDVNDLSTDMPIIMLNSAKTLGDPKYVESGREAIKKMFQNKTV